MHDLALAFSSMAASVQDGDRAFSTGLFNEPTRPAVGSLLARCEQGSCEYGALLAAVSSFYAKHLKATRCDDTFTNENHQNFRREAIANLNVRLRRAGLKDQVVGEPEGENITLDHGYEILDFMEKNQDYRQFMLQIQSSSRMADEDSVRVLLRQIERWEKPDSMPDRDFFLMKSEIYGGVSNKAAATPLAGLWLRRNGAVA